MLNCSVCGVDNFPVTNSRVIGPLTTGESLRLVERCHNCGTRITETCAVCKRLHPLNTTFCSVEGIKIEDFKARRIDVEQRISAFKLTEVMQRLNYERKRNMWIVLAMDIIILLGIFFCFQQFQNKIDLWLGVISAIAMLIAPLIERVFFMFYHDDKVEKAWKMAGNKEKVCVNKDSLCVYDDWLVSLIRQETSL